MIISTDVKQALDKIRRPFIMNKLGIKGTLFNRSKGIYGRPTATITLHGGLLPSNLRGNLTPALPPPFSTAWGSASQGITEKNKLKASRLEKK